MTPSSGSRVGDDVCILLATCDKYRVVAEWTARVIDASWTDHPAVRLHGLGDDRDWMSVTLDGVRSAVRDGFRWIYLVLDDHPPVGLCNAPALNTELPRLAAELGAVNIGLLGWGQRRGREGKLLGADRGRLLLNDASSRWKFSLHPALWSAEALTELLVVRLGQFSGSERNPWNFERHRDAPDGPVRRELLENTYQVNGQSMALGSRILDEVVRQPALLAFDAFRFVLRILGGQSRRDAFDRDNLWLYHYYRGPYPILWSGTMRKGAPSRDFENFLRFSGRRRLLCEWRAIKRQLAAPC